jgi:hypothetical protein
MTMNKMSSKKESEKHFRRLWPAKTTKYEARVLDDLMVSLALPVLILADIRQTIELLETSCLPRAIL